MTPIMLPSPTSTERDRIVAGCTLSGKALDRLYERRSVLDELIRSLEDYQKTTQGRKAELLEFVTSARRCS
jgi:hypothetical protein